MKHIQCTFIIQHDDDQTENVVKYSTTLTLFYEDKHSVYKHENKT